MVKALIFDCFGVIIGRGFKRTYLTAGGDPLKDKEFINECLDKTNYGYISRHEFDQLMADKIGITLEEWGKAVIKSEQADEEILNYIVELRKKYKTALLSNASKGILRNNFGPYNMESYFDVLVTSAEEGIIKPDPRIYLLCAEKLGLKLQECIFIDDNQINVDGANQTGMTGILYKNVQDLKDQLNKAL